MASIKGFQLKNVKRTLGREGGGKCMVTNVRDIERRLNDGLNRTSEEHEKCYKWLVEFMGANDMTLKELDDLCWQDSNWVFNQIFGE